MTEPTYWRVRKHNLEYLVDKTPESELMVSARDYWAAKKVTEEMVNRFLQWDVPKSVCSDPCMSMSDYQFPRAGTCIMGPAEARAMLEFVTTVRSMGAKTAQTARGADAMNEQCKCPPGYCADQQGMGAAFENHAGCRNLDRENYCQHGVHTAWECRECSETTQNEG